MTAPRHGRQAAASILASVACLLAAASFADANGYHDLLCRIPCAGRPAPADDVFYTTNGVYVYSGNGCAGGGSLYAAIDGGVPHPYGDGGWVTFSAPAGMTISALTVWRYEADTATQPFGAPASNLSYAPGGVCPASEAGTLSSQYNVYAGDVVLVDHTPPTIGAQQGYAYTASASNSIRVHVGP